MYHQFCYWIEANLMITDSLVIYISHTACNKMMSLRCVIFGLTGYGDLIVLNQIDKPLTVTLPITLLWKLEFNLFLFKPRRFRSDFNWQLLSWNSVFKCQQLKNTPKWGQDTDQLIWSKNAASKILLLTTPDYYARKWWLTDNKRTFICVTPYHRTSLLVYYHCLQLA